MSLAANSVPLAPALLDAVAHRAHAAGVFAGVRVAPGQLSARAACADAEYRLFADAGRAWVSLATPDRWLSQSIEQDLVHTGDTLDDLIHEELADQGLDAPRPRCEHFRSDDKHFTFRTPLHEGWAANADPAGVLAAYLLAYEACFRRLGDMEGAED
jgi:hypothetical protein